MPHMVMRTIHGKVVLLMVACANADASNQSALVENAGWPPPYDPLTGGGVRTTVIWACISNSRYLEFELDFLPLQISKFPPNQVHTLRGSFAALSKPIFYKSILVGRGIVGKLLTRSTRFMHFCTAQGRPCRLVAINIYSPGLVTFR